MKLALKIGFTVLMLIIGFAAGWLSREAYRPTVHVVVDDIPFISGSNLPKPKDPSCGTPAECLTAAECELLAVTDRKTHKKKYPPDCAEYAKKHAAQSEH